MPSVPLPQDITAQLRRLQADVDRLARTGGYGSAGNGLGDDVVRTEASQTLKNKVIDGTENSLSNIPKEALPQGIVYQSLEPPKPIQINDSQVTAQVQRFYPGIWDSEFSLQLGQSTLTGHYRQQGRHVWFKLFLEVGRLFYGGTGQLRLGLPWQGIYDYNQTLNLHYFQPVSYLGNGYIHWGGLAELVAGTSEVHTLTPFNNDHSDLGQITEGPGAVPYPGPGGTYPVFSQGSRLWVSGDIFIN
jgi:hypothetical protein